MRVEEGESWFARWEEQLLRPEELTPLSQTLITPDLALAFDIAAPPPPSAAASHPPHRHHQAEEYEGGGEAVGGEEPARTLKRPRLVWTPQLHKRFVDAVAHLGITNAVPKTIMQLMSVDGLTRENVASHLQKYRLYLKRMQGPAAAAAAAGVSPADQQLFATAPVPPHLLSPMAALHHHHMAAAAQQQYYQLGHFGSTPGVGSGFDHHGFLPRAAPQPGFHHMVGPAGLGVPYAPPAPAPMASYVEDLESGTAGGEGGRRILTLFPTGDE